jgi:reticulocyte-binding protein
MELMQKYNLVKDEYNKTNDEINMFNNKLNETQMLIKDQEKNLIILDNDIKSTRNIIDHQIMSRAEYDIKQEENNNILNKIESIKNDIAMLQNQKKELINTNQNLINKLTIMANDINNIDINNSKKIKTMNDFDNNNENDISYLLNMTFVNKEIKNNINNNEPDKNKDLLLKYDDFINKYKSYITEIKNEYNNNLINNNELSKNKDLIKTEIDKYSNMFINNNKISNDRKELIYKINNEYTKYKKDNDDFINIIKNDIKILENNINDKRKKSVEVENEFNKLKKEFDEYKNETYKIINALMERYNLYYNNFIDNSNEITSKIINCNRNLNEICNDLAKNVNKENERNENVIQKNK